jgi:serine/threonine protein kinase
VGTTIALQPGQIFRDYRLVRRIGKGGMGEVWLAFKLGPAGRDFRRVALKILLPHLMEDDDYVGMFISEARIAAKLEHPNIVQVFEFGEDEALGRLWFAQEYVEGADLRSIRKVAPDGVPYPLAAFIVGEMLSALDYAHDNVRGADGRILQLVHRDVTPANVLVADMGHVKITDFGIAKIFGEATADSSRTRTGQIRGTIGYLAPELLTGGRATARTDLYSLGVVFWEMLAGRRLYYGDDRLKANFEGAVPALRDVGRVVPASLEDVVRVLLARDSERRFPSAQAVLQALRVADGGRDSSEVEVRSFLAGLAVRRSTSTSSSPGEQGAPHGSLPELVTAPPTRPTEAEPAAIGRTGTGDMGLVGEGPCTAGTAGDTSPASLAAPPEGAAARTAWRRMRALAALGVAVAAGVVAAVAFPNGDPPRQLDAENARPADRAAGATVAPDPVDGGGPSAGSLAHDRIDASPPESVTVREALDLEPRIGSGSAKRGSLDVRVDPWAEVWVDGKSLGTTPVSRKLAPGRHRVKLVNNVLGKEETVTVKIGSGLESVVERQW